MFSKLSNWDYNSYNDDNNNEKDTISLSSDSLSSPTDSIPKSQHYHSDMESDETESHSSMPPLESFTPTEQFPTTEQFIPPEFTSNSETFVPPEKTFLKSPEFINTSFKRQDTCLNNYVSPSFAYQYHSNDYD